MLGQERIQRRNDIAAAEIDRRTEPYRPRDLLDPQSNESFQFVGLGQETACTLNQQSSFIGQVDGACRVMQECCSIVFFERNQPLGDGSRREAEFPPGSRQAAFFDDTEEQDQVIEDHHS
jgi:hypothetical protein